MNEIKKTLRKLKPFIGRKADRIWMRYSTAGRDEMAQWQQMVNLLANKYHVDAIEDEITLPPPPKEIATGDILIGRTNYLNRPSCDFGVNFAELTRHVGIFGSTGTGKTTLSKNILRELITRDIPFIVFDWEKTYRALIHEHSDIKIFTVGADTAPFYFNYFKMPDGVTFKEYVKSIIEVFSRAYIGGAGSDSVLLKVFDSIYQHNPVPTTKDALDALSDDMKGNLRGREMLWKQSSLRMLEFLCYGGTGEMFNVAEGYPIEDLLNQQVIFELGALSSDYDKRFFIEMFTLWYWLYKEMQGIYDDTLKHVLVFEEFHNIVDNSKKDDLIQKIFRQIRKYGTALVVIDQTPSLIPTAVFENLYTKITFSLNHKRNVTAIADAMYMETDEPRFIGQLKTGQAICRLMGRYPHPFLIDIPFVKPGSNISDASLRTHMQDFYKQYPPEKPGKAQTATLQTPPTPFTPSPLERIFLEDIVVHPFDGVDRRAKRLGLNPRQATSIQETIAANDLVTPVTVERRKLFELTEKGKQYVTDRGAKNTSDKNQGIAHRYYVDKIAHQLTQKGWSIQTEKENIDLVAESDERVAAIEVETGRNNPHQIQRNIDKITRFESTDKFVVATTADALSKIRTLIQDTKSQPPIRIMTASEFFKHPPV